MSLTTQTLKRLPYIQQGIHEGLNRQQIGDSCGVTEKTIDRDMNSWVESGLFEVWIKKEFVETYPDIKKEDKVLAFQEIAKLVGKMLTRKIERKEQIDIREKVEINITELLAKYEPALTRARHRTLQTDNPIEQVDPSQTNTETS